jgi:hypothetical protein
MLLVLTVVNLRFASYSDSLFQLSSSLAHIIDPKVVSNAKNVIVFFVKVLQKRSVKANIHNWWKVE